MKIIPVILSGGSGSRLWPLSRSSYPKQLIPLISKKTMLQETISRIIGWDKVEEPIVICGNAHRFIVAEQIRDINVKPRLIILEPEGRNTAPAIAAAALSIINEENCVMLVLPADHVIRNIGAFERTVKTGLEHLNEQKLITFGIKPAFPDTGYGYIQLGKSVPNIENSYEIRRFVEKPDLKTAKNYIKNGDYLWNSGMFLFKPKTYISELNKFEPKIVNQVSQSLKNSYSDLDFLRLSENEFKLSPATSIDYAVMEKTKLGIILKTDIGWSDVGSWATLSSILSKDENKNTLRGDTYTLETKNTFIRSESRLVATIGIENLIIIDTPDALLISDKSKTQSVKKIVEFIDLKGRTEHEFHKKNFRPWGFYESLIKSNNFQVKSIIIKPGEQLSLQLHKKRAEHWVVVKGVALVTVDEKQITLIENQSTYIPIGSKHRLANAGEEILHIIEIQSGNYLEEDDIIRFDDDYGRT